MTQRVMVIAAHPDDEILGCGGTMARHIADGDEVSVLWIADGETSRLMAAQPNRNMPAFKACTYLGVKQHAFLDYPDQKLDRVPLLEITQRIEHYVRQWQPTIVYTHHANDLNRDHQIVHQAAMTALRPLPGSSCKSIYAFEVLSSTEWGDGFRPNHFVDVSGGFFTKKMKALSFYEDEMRPFPHPRSELCIYALSKLRGATVGVEYAEAFITMRSVK